MIRGLSIFLFSFFLITCTSSSRKASLEEEKIRTKLFFQEIDYPYPKTYLYKQFPASNEKRINLFHESIRDLGGTYLGVGTDQNFSLAAWANSEYVFLMDFDRLVVYINRIHIFFFSISPRFADYEELWSVKNRSRSYSLLKEAFGKQSDFRSYSYAFHQAHNSGKIRERFQLYKYMTKQFQFESLHNNEIYYGRIHHLAKSNRIYSVPGSLLGNQTMKSIARSIESLGSKLMVLYLSNAEDYFVYEKSFKENLMIQPITKESMILRTVQPTIVYKTGNPIRRDIAEDRFHYNAQRIQNFKDFLEQDTTDIFDMLRYRRNFRMGFSGF